MTLMSELMVKVSVKDGKPDKTLCFKGLYINNGSLENREDGWFVLPGRRLGNSKSAPGESVTGVTRCYDWSHKTL